MRSSRSHRWLHGLLALGLGLTYACSRSIGNGATPSSQETPAPGCQSAAARNILMHVAPEGMPDGLCYKGGLYATSLTPNSSCLTRSAVRGKITQVGTLGGESTVGRQVRVATVSSGGGATVYMVEGVLLLAKPNTACLIVYGPSGNFAPGS